MLCSENFDTVRMKEAIASWRWSRKNRREEGKLFLSEM